MFSQNFDSFNIKENRKNGYCKIDINSELTMYKYSLFVRFNQM